MCFPRVLAHRRRCRGRRPIVGQPRVVSGGLPAEAVHRVPRTGPMQLLHDRLFVLAVHRRRPGHVPETPAADAQGELAKDPDQQMRRLPEDPARRPHVGARFRPFSTPPPTKPNFVSVAALSPTCRTNENQI